MNWLPSQHMPLLDMSKLDWRIKMAMGQDTLSQLWENLWWSGVAAGRAEGIVATLLVVLVLAVLALIVIVAVRWYR